MKIYHWNVENKTTSSIADPTFVRELASVLGGASVRDNYGTVVVLTEIMNSVTPDDFQGLLDKLNKKAGKGWSGEMSFAGLSEGGVRREKIAILHRNVAVEGYWQIVRDSESATRSVLERRLPGGKFDKEHKKNSRFPFGITVRVNLGSGEESIDIGGYHNQGPSSGAGTQAGAVLDDARRLGVHVLTGDLNTEPPAKRRRLGDEGANTRWRDLLEATTESSVATSRGGSLFDRTVLTNDDLGDRQLVLKNDTGWRGSSSDHAWNSAILTTRSWRGQAGAGHRKRLLEPDLD